MRPGGGAITCENVQFRNTWNGKENIGKRSLIQEKIDVYQPMRYWMRGADLLSFYDVFQKIKCCIDPLLAFYRVNIPHFKEENFTNVDFEKIKLEQLAKQNCFDIIFCLNAINHVKYIDKSICKTSELH
ncbi:MAG: hypothetical protein R2825_19585 [Saprospiraceae bacterium]